MGTKNKPGKFDCYDNAEPDEPMFVLLGRDPFAPALVEFWAHLREESGDDPQKVTEARVCAHTMRAWLERCGRQEATVEFLDLSKPEPLSVLKGCTE